MKQAKQRVVAIDYFRGLCILAVILNHSMLFSMPFAYLSGASMLWTSAAEMFLLLSGLTLGIVRGSRIKDDFKNLTLKMWRRSAYIYLINIIIVSLSLLLALYFTSHGVNNYILGELPHQSGLSLLWSMANLSYGIGWASFLALYSVYMVFAPFLLYALRSKFWYTVPLVSLTFFVFNYIQPEVFGYASNFALWQVYFVMGLVLSRFRVSIISRAYSLNRYMRKGAATTVLLATSLILALNILLNFNISPYVDRMVHQGLIPARLEAYYIQLLQHRSRLDIMFMNSRTGVLRPAITLLFLAAAYILYQRHKQFLLRQTGRYINKLGSETMWVFVAQALAIPLLAALPLPRNVLTNSLLTIVLVTAMWQVANRREILVSAKSYVSTLKNSYSQAKYNYLSRYEDA